MYETRRVIDAEWTTWCNVCHSRCSNKAEVDCQCWCYLWPNSKWSILYYKYILFSWLSSVGPTQSKYISIHYFIIYI